MTEKFLDKAIAAAKGALAEKICSRIVINDLGLLNYLSASEEKLEISVGRVLLYNMKGIFTPPRIDVNLVFTSIKGVYTSVVFLAFTVIGVLIGLFIK